MNKAIKIIMISLLSAIVIIAVCHAVSSKMLPGSIKKLKFEDIKSARIESSRTGASPVKKYNFDLNNPAHVKVLKGIINSLSSAEFQGYENVKVTNKSGSPAFLILELKNGSTVQIRSAINEKVTRLSDGSTEISQSGIPNEVAILMNSNRKPFRILSPEIKELIDGGYKDIFNKIEYKF